MIGQDTLCWGMFTATGTLICHLVFAFVAAILHYGYNIFRTVLLHIHICYVAPGICACSKGPVGDSLWYNMHFMSLVRHLLMLLLD